MARKRTREEEAREQRILEDLFRAPGRIQVDTVGATTTWESQQDMSAWRKAQVPLRKVQQKPPVVAPVIAPVVAPVVAPAKLRPLDKYGRPIVQRPQPSTMSTRMSNLQGLGQDMFTQVPGNVVSSGSMVRARRQAEREAYLKAERERTGVVKTEAETDALEEQKYQKGLGRQVSEEQARFELGQKREETEKQKNLSNYETAWETISIQSSDTPDKWALKTEATQLYDDIQKMTEWIGKGGDVVKMKPLIAARQKRLGTIANTLTGIEKQKAAAETTAAETKAAAVKTEAETKRAAAKVQATRERTGEVLKRADADLEAVTKIVDKLDEKWDKTAREHAESLATIKTEQEALEELQKDPVTNKDSIIDAKQKINTAQAKAAAILAELKALKPRLERAYRDRRGAEGTVWTAKKTYDKAWQEEPSADEQAAAGAKGRPTAQDVQTYSQRAGGDREKTRELMRADGYEVD